MAYPFPKVASAPQTPQHLQGIESPRINLTSRDDKVTMAKKRVLLLVITFLAFIIWLIDPFPNTLKRTDQIPFSSGLVDELDSCPLPLGLGANRAGSVTLIIMRAIRTAASHHRTSTFVHRSQMDMTCVG